MTLTKKILIMLSLIVSTTIVALIVYLGSAYFFSTGELSKTFKRIDHDPTSQAIANTEPFSVLLMGVDTGSKERKSTWEGNSDSLILVTVNPKTNKTTMTSLERDILTNLVGPKNNKANDTQAKLNAAYASGGAEMAMMTVRKLLDIPIDYYMQINMQGLVDLVNAVGGIKVTNDFDFPISIEKNEPEFTATVEPGTHHINGEQALVYSRMRYDDPEGDYGRQKRQREVIQKVMQKILNLGDSVASYKKILSAVSDNMQTDIKINASTIPSLFKYSTTIQQVKEYQLRGEDATLNGISYQIPTTQDILKTQNIIKEQLGLKLGTIDSLKTNLVTYEELHGIAVAGESSSTLVNDETNTSSFNVMSSAVYKI